MDEKNESKGKYFYPINSFYLKFLLFFYSENIYFSQKVIYFP